MKIFVFVITYFLLAGNAYACGNNYFNFGDGVSKVVSDLKLYDDVGRVGNFSIMTRGKNLCADMPSRIEAELVFIDDKFVQVKLYKQGGLGPLFAFAEKHFGKSTKSTKKVGTKNPRFQYVWPLESVKTVAYSATKRNQILGEYLEITSRKHSNLFAERFKHLEKQANKGIK